MEDEFGVDNIYSINTLPFEMMFNIEQALLNSLGSGNLMGYPIMGIRIRIMDGKVSMRR